MTKRQSDEVYELKMNHVHENELDKQVRTITKDNIIINL